MNLPVSTYYKLKYKAVLQPSEQEMDIRDKLERLAVEFPGYGYRRMTAALRQIGMPINHKRVLRLMRQSDLLCRLNKTFRINTTDSNHGYPRYPNLLKDLDITGLNEVWQADITYIRIARGFVYLAMILDAFSRKVIGYAISEQIDTGLALSALKMAVATRKPPPGCIHHSDQGIQYACHEYTEYLQDHEFGISMSRRGNCYDNAKAESFFKTLKREEVWLNDYQTIADVKKCIPYFIEQVYNAKRLHSALGYCSPDAFEKALENKPEQHSQAVLN